MLEEGLTYTSRMTVTLHDTAQYVESGDLPVLATPRMVSLMEKAAMHAVVPYLSEGDATVGGYIESSHLSPSPVGAEVCATAKLTKIEGRKLHFEVEAYQGDTLIGQGRHTRFIVNREKFLSKL